MAEEQAAKKAKEFISKADKKLNSWFGKLTGSSQMYEDAEELYTKAANQLKVAKAWQEAGATFEKSAQCHMKMESPHDAASSYNDAANCYKKDDVKKAVLMYKEVVSLYIDLGRFVQAAKTQKEIGELYESDGETSDAMAAFTTAAEYYQAEENHSTANQMQLKVASLAVTVKDYKKAIDIFERVGLSALESNLLKFSVKGYYLMAGLCRLASSDSAGSAMEALDRYEAQDATFSQSREGVFLRDIATAVDGLDEDAFTDKVRTYDEISRLDPQKTGLLLEIKTKIKGQVEDIT